MPDARHGVLTPHEEVLSMVHGVSRDVAVLVSKLDVYIESDKERKREVEVLRRELADLKVRVYSMAAVITVVGSVLTSWVAGRL